MKYLHWRNEGKPIEQGLTVYRLTDRGIGFILNLDRWFIRCRYSKVVHKLFWHCERREPRAWRMLKKKDELWQ
jgi:hypothetical protein